ncbi:CDP-diacylglycerol--serine O-phosphatidyltransferase [Saccharibacillus endophyticus]|uniref:CDP-diacylglycerol--serine O-phosphatidyltransferase n=1 Tax=Saccharibacillus endophyticus TaxID=2060666 RepID=A0ABQ1ZJ87_9BACL|nr:CDP-diacylglycerol--serine O-phosphatidyltransferase [Saccharibacillus endophyticus]GGH67560.1 CDP-diacylglycerol--serine O-phosphatidyltransferase [Saccharibacillus endophyticus]
MRKMIPSALTLANLLLGFLALLFIFKDELVPAICLILLGLLCDFFDGYFARKLDAASELGKELDSLADLVTFGVAPAALVYVASLHEIAVLGALCCVIYLCCCAVRLARFNVKQACLAGFVGMPTPLAAILILLISVLSTPGVTAIGMLAVGALMVSRISFPGLKKMKSEPAEEYR